MTATAYKLLGALRVEAGRSFTLTKKNGSPVVGGYSGEATPGLYYPSGDGEADDLVELLNTRMLAAIIAAGLLGTGTGCAFSVTDKGELSVSLTGCTSLSIQLDGDTAGGSAAGETFTDLAAWLRIYTPGNPTEVTLFDGVVAPMPANPPILYTFFPRRYLVEEADGREDEVSEFVPTSGNVQTLHVATRAEKRLEVRTEGFPRAAGYNEYHALDSFMEEAATGRPFRLYADTTVSDAYSPSQRLGYQALKLKKKSMGWRPKPDQGGWYKYHNVELDCWEWA